MFGVCMYVCFGVLTCTLKVNNNYSVGHLCHFGVKLATQGGK